MDPRLENSVFECPKGFSKEDVASQLYLEDLDEDSELWLVRMPSHVDPSALENHQIDLSSDLNKISNGDNNFDCISERCKMPNLSLVLPQKESKTLTRVKKMFQGSILLYDTMIEDDDVPVKVEEEEHVVEVVNGETDDSNFVKPQSKKHKHSKHQKAANSQDESPIKMEEEAENVVEENNGEADDTLVKRKSKKHKHIRKLDSAQSESDISFITEDSETGTTKKKKKKKSIVKLEPSSEGDEFPNCVSQQN